MNRHSLRVLEFEKIRARVRDRCLTAEAAREVARERLETDAAALGRLLDHVGVIKSAFGTGVDVPTLSFPPVATTLDRTEKEGSVLEPIDLAEIAVFAKSTLLLHRYLMTAAGEAATTAAMESVLGEAPDVSHVPARLFRYVDPDGTVREREIPELRAIRAQILRCQQDLQSTANGLTNREDVRRFLSATVPTQRDGRTVIALKADHRGKLPGIVHEVSGSGATVFIEPQELVVRNNAVVEAENRYRNELLKILRDLTSFCRSALPDLRAGLAWTVDVDRIFCRARFSYDFSCERASVAEGSLTLRGARHPLLGDSAVPINVEIPPGKRVLIVTGPNTGGKTVTLKTIGLLSLMNQFGLEVPAAPGSELPIFAGVFADIGDEQSIEQNLSTFSGHMRNIARILNHADDRSLVLLDELGSGTDPEEGGALAMSILDELLARQPFTVVTTHHGRLKHFGFTHDRATNASVEFDSQSLRPTYHIIPGVPGSSHAVEIAAQMGILRSVTGKARDYLAGEEYDTGRIIRRLTDREQELHQQARQFEERERELAEERREMHDRIAELDRREAEIRSGKLRDLDRWASEARSHLENLVREIREGELTREKTQAVKGFISDLDEQIRNEREALSRPVEQRPASVARESVHRGGPAHPQTEATKAPLGEGTRVRIRESGKEGTIYRRGKAGSWIVQVGPVRLPVDEHELIPLASAEPSPAQSERGGFAGAYAGMSARPELELDVRGYRLDEAIDAVERQIDQALISGLNDFGIVHGMGEGVLQRGVRELLREHPHVSDYSYARPEEGGYGKTNVHLR